MLVPARLLALLALAGLAGCPATSGHGTGDGGPGGDGNPGDAGVCTEVPSCPVTFRYAGAATTVELRGDFRADGWTAGVPLVKSGNEFAADVAIEDGRTVQYKLVVDGTWITDPGNPDQVSDGFGGQNSVVTAHCDACPHAAFDWRDGIMYFVFVDRFFDGDPANDSPVTNVPTEANYQGGDLAGVKAKLDAGYFSDLGVNVLWLTSPIDNQDGIGLGDDGRNYAGYHGYWPSKLDQIESRLGTIDDLRAVVAAAHARGIKVVLDYVMNHVSDESPVYAAHPDWFWPLQKDGHDCVCGGGCDWNGPDGRRCWFRPYLPDFDFTNPDARAFSVGNAMQWVKDTGIDGFRLDAIKQIETQWIVDLRNRVREDVQRNGDEFYLIGETFDGDSGLIASYVDPDTKLDGQFDFPLRAQLVRTLLARQGSLSDLDGFLTQNATVYNPRAVMGTFIGNHDLPRAIHLAEDTPLFGEWDSGKARGWDNRPSLPAYARPFERVALAYAFLMTTPGLPLIYNGDEIGMAGGGDPDNRRPMQWSGTTADQDALKATITKLIHLRSAHPALRRGTRTSLGSSTDTMTYSMNGEGETIYVALNRGDGEAAASGVPAGNYTDLVTGDAVTAPLTVPARGFLILAPK